MKLTDALRGEHAVIYQLFEHVRETLAGSDDLHDIRGVVAVMERILLSHAQIEERLLFPNLEPHLGQRGPLEVMRAEHREIDELFDAARKETDVGALKTVVGELLDLANDHFAKEEQALFAMAQQVLDDGELTALGDAWAASRNVALGGGGCMGMG